MKKCFKPLLALCGLMLVFAAALGTSGCAINGNMKSPAAIASQVCTPLETALTSLSALQGWTVDQKQTLADVQPKIDVVCKAGATVDITSLKTLAATGFPALIAVIQVSPMSSAEQSRVILGLSAVEIILEAVLDAQPNATLVAMPSQAQLDAAVQVRPAAAWSALSRRPE